jgi:hypothetical protein
MTKLGNTLPRAGDRMDPYTACRIGEDVKPNRILDCLQPFGRIAYVTDRTKIKAKQDSKAFKCVFVGYATDHSGDTYKFYKQNIRFYYATSISGWNGTGALRQRTTLCYLTN